MSSVDTQCKRRNTRGSSTSPNIKREYGKKQVKDNITEANPLQMPADDTEIIKFNALDNTQC